MKRATIMLMVFALLGALVPMNAQIPAGASQVVIGFTGGSTWTSGSTGICIWYFPVLGNLDLKSLFATDASGNPVIDKEHAYLIWVSDWSIQAGAGNGPFSLAVVPAGTATIYFSNNPTGRDWRDLSKRSSWGIPVATFVRGAGLFHSADSWASDKFYFSAPLTGSKSFSVNGKQFNFRNLIPNGNDLLRVRAGGEHVGGWQLHRNGPELCDEVVKHIIGRRETRPIRPGRNGCMAVARGTGRAARWAADEDVGTVGGWPLLEVQACTSMVFWALGLCLL